MRGGGGGDLRTIRRFARLWPFQVLSMAGDWLSLVALRSLLLELTGSGMSVSALLLYTSVPSLLVAPFAGVRAPGEGLLAGEVGGRGGWTVRGVG